MRASLANVRSEALVLYRRSHELLPHVRLRVLRSADRYAAEKSG